MVDCSLSTFICKCTDWGRAKRGVCQATKAYNVFLHTNPMKGFPVMTFNTAIPQLA